MAAKRNISYRMAKRLCERLELSVGESTQILSALDDRAEVAASPAGSVVVHSDRGDLISKWQYLAVLNLIQLPGIKATSETIARRLGLPMAETLRVLNTLESFELVKEDKNNHWIRTCGNLVSTDEIKTQMIEESHRRFLNLAIEKIEQVELSQRDFTTMTFGINPRKMKEAKKLIRNFQDQLAALLEDNQASEVYIFGTQLVPVTRSLK